MTAAAGDMVLTRNGDLYRVVPTDDGLVVTQRFADGSNADYLVPQTSGIVASSLQVGVDERTGAIFVAWQQGDGPESTIEVAWLADQWWMGPYDIAGWDGSAVENLHMTLDRVVDFVEEDGEQIEVATTFLHLVWWNYSLHRDDGSAFLASLPLTESGNLELDTLDPVSLSDLLPYGIGCEGINDVAGLAHPMLFSDPQSGAPHIFATDFPNCLFQILRVQYDVVEDLIGDTKRRRHIVLLGHASMIAVNPAVVLETANVEVGHDLDVVMYWDTEDAVAYVQLDENGVPPVQFLPVGDGLSRERAIEVIRNLVH
jgi:hypothetical protein